MTAAEVSKSHRSQKFQWREDPKESYSDWIIAVTSAADAAGHDNNHQQLSYFHEPILEPQTVDIYHVHKTFLASGGRKSSYFCGLFNSHMIMMKEAEDGTTRLSLEHSEAKAFPQFLDFLYGGQLHVTRESVVPLFNLGDYFGIESLKEAVFAFVRKDFSPSSACFFSEEQQVKSNTSVPELGSCVRAASQWAHVRDELLSRAIDRTNLIDILLKMLTLEQKNLLFHYAMREAGGDKMLQSIEESKRAPTRLMEQCKSENFKQIAKGKEANLKDEIAELEQEIAQLELQLEANEEALLLMNETKNGLEDKIKILLDDNEESNALKAKLARLNHQNESNVRAISSLKEKALQLEKENAELHDKCQSEVTMLKEVNGSNSKTISLLKQKNIHLEKMIANLNQQHQNELSMVEAERSKLVKHHKNKVAKLKSDGDKLDQHHRSEVARIRAESSKLKRQCELLEELYWTNVGR